LQAEDVRNDRAVARDRPCSELALDGIEELEEVGVVHRQVALRRIRDRALARDVARKRRTEPVANKEVVDVEGAEGVRHFVSA
jgi:hypothetical protein